MKIAVIPARGGSKRIPRKNIRPFGGRPMIGWSIAAARDSGLFERVIVSTDDGEIAAIALALGAEVPFRRPPELSNDHAGTIEVIAHAVRWLADAGVQPQAVCCLYATAPFVRAADLAAAAARFDQGRWDYVFAATGFDFPIFRGFRENADGGVQMFFPEHFETRSQDLPEALHDAGQFYFGRPQAWLQGLPVFGPTSAIVRLPRWRVQDIDTEEDWQMAERLMQLDAASRG